MIYLCAGMPRAGSGWHYNLIHDVVVADGGQDAREIRRRFRLGRILTEVNCNIGALTTRRLLPVMLPSLLGRSFAIKAHAAPKRFARAQIQAGRIKAIYIFRDPRAAMLSAYEYGQRGLQDERPNAFSHLTSIDVAIDFMLEYLRIWEAWMRVEQALHVRYEDLLAHYDDEIVRLLPFLGIKKFSRPEIVEVVEKYRPGKASQDDQGLHYHKGQPERFREALSQEQLERCNQAFSHYLPRMGYYF